MCDLALVEKLSKKTNFAGIKCTKSVRLENKVLQE